MNKNGNRNGDTRFVKNGWLSLFPVLPVVSLSSLRTDHTSSRIAMIRISTQPSAKMGKRTATMLIVP